MTARCAAISATLTLARLLSTGSARAGDGHCPLVSVEADADVGARWPDLAGQIHAALDARADVDACARITLTVTPGAITLRVELPDGRSTARPIARREDVVPTLEALLLLPRQDTPSTAPTATAAPVDASAVKAAAARTPALPAAPSATVTSDAARPAPPPVEPGRFRLEFALATAARIGDGQRGVSVGAITFFDLAGWLVGFEGAIHYYDGADGAQTGGAMELALLGGRRLRFGNTALDLIAGPAVALRGPGSSRVSMAAGTSGGAMPPETSDGPWTRLRGGARVTFRARSVLRPFTGLDGDFGWARAVAPPHGGEPNLPRWTVGLIVGATVGAP